MKFKIDDILADDNYVDIDDNDNNGFAVDEVVVTTAAVTVGTAASVTDDAGTVVSLFDIMGKAFVEHTTIVPPFV